MATLARPVAEEVVVTDPGLVAVVGAVTDPELVALAVVDPVVVGAFGAAGGHGAVSLGTLA